MKAALTAPDPACLLFAHTMHALLGTDSSLAVPACQQVEEKRLDAAILGLCTALTEAGGPPVTCRFDLSCGAEWSEDCCLEEWVRLSASLGKPKRVKLVMAVREELP